MNIDRDQLGPDFREDAPEGPYLKQRDGKVTEFGYRSQRLTLRVDLDRQEATETEIHKPDEDVDGQEWLEGWVSRARELALPKSYEASLCCAFCGKSNQEVRKLIAGPSVYICNECIELCYEIVSEPAPGGP